MEDPPKYGIGLSFFFCLSTAATVSVGARFDPGLGTWFALRRQQVHQESDHEELEAIVDVTAADIQMIILREMPLELICAQPVE